MLLILFGRLAQIGLLMATMRAATTALAPAEMGRMSVIMTIVSFFTLFLVSPVGMFINRRLHVWDAQGNVRRYGVYFALYLCVLGVLSAPVLGAMNLSGALAMEVTSVWLITLVCGTIVFNAAAQTAIPALNLLGFRGIYMSLTLITIAASLLSAWLFITRFTPTAEYWMAGILLGQVIMAFVGARMLLQVVQERDAPVESWPKAARSEGAMLFEFAWPVGISVGLYWIQAQSYRFGMAEQCGLSSLGLFVSGYGISSAIISAFEMIFTAYFQPMFYKRVADSAKSEQARAWEEYAASILPSLIVLGCFLLAVAPELAKILLGPSFETSSQYVVWGVFAEVMRVTGSMYGMAAHARMKTKLLLLPNLLGAVVSVAMIRLFVPMWGPGGAGAALSLSGFIALLSTHAMLRREMTMTLPFRLIGQAAASGGLLLAAAIVGRSMLLSGSGHGIAATGAFLAVFGTALILFQWRLLRAILPDQRSITEIFMGRLKSAV